MTRAITFAFGALGACAVPQRAREVSPCPDEPTRVLAAPVQLGVSVGDMLTWPAPWEEHACDGIAPRVVRIAIDKVPWCEVSIPCSVEVREPPRTFACRGAPIPAGARFVTAALVGTATEAGEQYSLPAFDRYGSGGRCWMFGAHIMVWVYDDHIRIAPPTPGLEMHVRASRTDEQDVRDHRRDHERDAHRA
jgi:hypothetical protein